MEGLLKLIAGNVGGPESGELTSGGTPAFGKHAIKGGVGASSARFHRAGSRGHSVYIRIGQTARHRSWSLAPAACAPLLASPAVRDAEQHPPESWTTGTVTLRRKGWGRNAGGG